VSVHLDVELPDLVLERGGIVQQHRTRVWFDGPRHCQDEFEQRQRVSASVPVVLVVHALTGDTQVSGAAGWWAPLVGDTKAIDTERFQVLCVNNLGSVYGSSNVAHHGFPRNAEVTPVDQARAIVQALDLLHVPLLHLATGGSLGGMIALSLASIAPTRVERLAVFGAPAVSNPWVLAFNHLQREIIASASSSERGLELARQVAMVSYRAEAGFEERQPRSRKSTGAHGFAIQNYLEHQGKKLAARFSAGAYLTQLGAMDAHDLTTTKPGLDAVRAASLIVDIDSDQLFTPVQVEALRQRLRSNGRSVTSGTIHSLHGHDAFLIEFEQVAALLKQSLSL
jgi:homoserine O-acetyltransferase/O-succinyltransferase